MCAQLHTRDGDRLIARLAECQGGVVSRAQLIEAGLTRNAIGHRLKRGRLHPVHRGVYAVGHRLLSADGRWMAAVLTSGPGAVLSHRSAAALWRIRQSTRSAAEVTTFQASHPRPGVERHRGHLAADEVTALRGVPVTTVPRTLLDLAVVVGRRDLERAMNDAEVRRLTDPLALEDLLGRYPRRRGVAAVKAILQAGRLGSTVTRSELETASWPSSTGRPCRGPRSTSVCGCPAGGSKPTACGARSGSSPSSTATRAMGPLPPTNGIAPATGC